MLDFVNPCCLQEHVDCIAMVGCFQADHGRRCLGHHAMWRPRMGDIGRIISVKFPHELKIVIVIVIVVYNYSYSIYSPYQSCFFNSHTGSRSSRLYQS